MGYIGDGDMGNGAYDSWGSGGQGVHMTCTHCLDLEGANG